MKCSLKKRFLPCLQDFSRSLKLPSNDQVPNGLAVLGVEMVLSNLLFFLQPVSSSQPSDKCYGTSPRGLSGAKID